MTCTIGPAVDIRRILMIVISISSQNIRKAIRQNTFCSVLIFVRFKTKDKRIQSIGTERSFLDLKYNVNYNSDTLG